jgi:hypothetical protein
MRIDNHEWRSSTTSRSSPLVWAPSSLVISPYHSHDVILNTPRHQVRDFCDLSYCPQPPCVPSHLMSTMDQILQDFTAAHAKEDGRLLASTIDPAGHAYLVYDFARSSSSSKIEADIRYVTVYNNALSLSKTDARAWQDVYVAYWKFAQEYISTETTATKSRANGSRGKTPAGTEPQWARIYDVWKDVVNTIIRGYSSSAFGAWTLPCLYVAGKYLRTFAIKADEQAARTKGSVTFNAGFQDDVVGALGKNDKLEDAARQINRIFSLCISDRFAMREEEAVGMEADEVTGHQLRSQESGQYTTSRTCCSRHISR